MPRSVSFVCVNGCINMIQGKVSNSNVVLLIPRSSFYLWTFRAFQVQACTSLTSSEARRSKRMKMNFSLLSHWCLIALCCSPLYIEARKGKRITSQTITFILLGICLYPENQQFYRQNHPSLNVYSLYSFSNHFAIFYWSLHSEMLKFINCSFTPLQYISFGSVAFKEKRSERTSA